MHGQAASLEHWLPLHKQRELNATSGCPQVTSAWQQPLMCQSPGHVQIFRADALKSWQQCVEAMEPCTEASCSSLGHFWDRACS